MKKTNNLLIIAFGIVVSFLSFLIDEPVNSFFKNARIPILDAILGILTNFGFVVIVMALTPSIILYKCNKKNIYSLWSVFFISVILSVILKLIIARQRPVEAFPFPFLNIIDYSFPSMHAVVAFSLMAMLNENLPKQKKFWVGFALLVAFSRIYFGVHYLSDVVFGALIGFFVGYYMRKKGGIETTKFHLCK